MKLFLLKRLDDVQYDEYRNCVVRASSHKTARKIAFKNLCGDEPNELWLNHKKTSCKEIKQTGLPEIILTDYHAG